MVDTVAAAGMEFCGAAACRRAKTLIGAEGDRRSAKAEHPISGRDYQPIEMPKNSATGFVTAFFAVVTGFALIWHIWWMVASGLVRRLRDDAGLRVSREEEIEIPAEQIARFDRAHQAEVRPMSIAIRHSMTPARSAAELPAKPDRPQSGSSSPTASGSSC